MDSLLLSAYQVLKALSEQESLREYHGVDVSYANVWPGKLIFMAPQSEGEMKRCLIPVWQVRIPNESWKKVGQAAKGDEVLYLDFSGRKISCSPGSLFERVKPGTVFKYAEGCSYMLQECGAWQHKFFVLEPEYAVGLKKFPILEVVD